MENEVVRVRKPKGNEVLGIIESMLGASKFAVRCQDNKMRICRLPGRLKKTVWIRTGYVVLVEPWKIQGEQRGDIIWSYTRAQADWLKRKGMLKNL